MLVPSVAEEDCMGPAASGDEECKSVSHRPQLPGSTGTLWTQLFQLSPCKIENIRVQSETG